MLACNMEAMEEGLGVGMRQAFADFMAHTLFYNCISIFLKHCATLDKHFSNTSYKNLERKIRSMDIFKELTFKETSTTTTNFRHKDFNYI